MREDEMPSTRRVKIVAPKSSKRGIVCCFMGETLLFDATKFTSTRVHHHTSFADTLRLHKLSRESEKPCN